MDYIFIIMIAQTIELLFLTIIILHNAIMLRHIVDAIREKN